MDRHYLHGDHRWYCDQVADGADGRAIWTVCAVSFVVAIFVGIDLHGLV